MSDLIRTILIMSISGGIIAFLLFILKPLMRNRMPKSAQYYLWLVVIVALLVPVSRFLTVETPLISETVGNYAISTNEQIDANQHLWLSELTNTQGEQLTQSGSVYSSSFVYERKNSNGEVIFKTSVFATVFTVFMFIYPIGMGAVLLYFIISYSIFTRLHQRRNTLASENENVILAKLCGERRPPLLYRNQLASTPMLFGVFRPVLILPDREYTDTQLHSVLLHELTHLRRKDILVKWLSVFACAVHWFNPVVWLVRHEIDSACELSCDESVIRNLDANGKQNYGETLIYVAADSKTPKAVLSTTMCEEKKALKERLGAIMKNKKHTRLAIILSVVLILAVGGTAIALGAGKTASLKEPPNITIKAGDIEIPWNVGLNMWNGNAYNRLDGFHVIMSQTTFEELPYIHNNETITITFNGKQPWSTSLSEYVLDENGDSTFRIGNSSYTQSLTPKGVSVLTPYYTTRLVSNDEDYKPGNTIKGFRLVCSWGDNECEYTFVFRGNAKMTMESSTDTVTIIIYKGNDKKTTYSLFSGDVIPAPSELSRGRIFTDIDELNAALAEYPQAVELGKNPQDILRMVLIKHTMDFTKDEMIIIGDMVKVPSGNYSKAVGLYEFHITTLEEAQAIVSEHYPNAAEIRYKSDDTISYTNPTAPVDVYSFEVDADGVTVICAVSKERGIFFTYNYGEWYAFTGLQEGSGATRYITLDDIREIAQKIGTDLTMGDLRDFIGDEVGSGLYIMRYFIEDSDYMLIVGSGGGNTVMYANLIHTAEGGENESIDIRYYDVDKFIKDETKELVRPLPEPQETTPPTALSEPPLYEIGKVSVFSNGKEYEPYEHFLYSLQVTESGQLASDGIPLRFEDVFTLLPEIQCSEDFRVDIIGNDRGLIDYSLYDDKFEIIYERESTFIFPDSAGVYILCVNVTWSNNATDTNFLEYTGLRYVFKIVK